VNIVRVISLKEWPRASICEHLSESYRTKLHATLHSELDVSLTEELRNSLLPVVQENYGARLSYTGILTKLTAYALRKHLILNTIVENHEAKVVGDINISVAVQSEKLGLITPVILNVDRKTLGQVASELNDLADKAVSGKISIRDLSEGTFTISNLGMLGSVDGFTQIMNPPQTAILGIGRIARKPLVVDGEIKVRSVCTFSLTYDHRVVDGYHAAEFMATMKEILENPASYIGSSEV